MIKLLHNDEQRRNVIETFFPYVNQTHQIQRNSNVIKKRNFIEQMNNEIVAL